MKHIEENRLLNVLNYIGNFKNIYAYDYQIHKVLQ